MGQVAATYRIGRAASPSRKQIRHVGGRVGVGARVGGCVAAVGIVVVVMMGGKQGRRAERDGWIEWNGQASRRSARDGGCHHRKVKIMFDLGWLCCNSAIWVEGGIAVGKSWLR